MVDGERGGGMGESINVKMQIIISVQKGGAVENNKSYYINKKEERLNNNKKNNENFEI